MPTIGSPDPPLPPPLQKTPDELAAISEAIATNNYTPSWEWTAYIYGTILPHIEELHEAGQLVEVIDEDSCGSDGYSFTGYRNKDNGKREGFGCCNNKTDTISPRTCFTYVNDVGTGHYIYHKKPHHLHLEEVKDGTDYGKTTYVTLASDGTITDVSNLFHTFVSTELGVFEEHNWALQDKTQGYYTVVGPTDSTVNLYEDVINGRYEMVPLRALDEPWEAYIC